MFVRPEFHELSSIDTPKGADYDRLHLLIEAMGGKRAAFATTADGVTRARMLAAGPKKLPEATYYFPSPQCDRATMFGKIRDMMRREFRFGFSLLVIDGPAYSFDVFPPRASLPPLHPLAALCLSGDADKR